VTSDFRLGDGSFVVLAPGSHLRTAPNNDREVWLEGRAFFAIKSDRARPFVVHTRAGDARVLGTRFVLDAHGDSVKLGVVEGRVELEGGGEQVVVGAGRVMRGSFGEPPTPAENADVSGLTEWIQGVLVFQETRIGRAAQDIERQYGVRVVFPDSAIRTRTITAIFHDQPLDSVLVTVCRAIDAQCRQRSDTVEIRP
jgi:ferric-dicitrate binding protein FerR (iron transport regulator)